MWIKLNGSDWKGKIKSQNFKSLFSFNLKIIILSQNWKVTWKFNFFNSLSIASIQARNDVWSVESMDWKGKIKSQNFKSLFSFNLKIIILSQNWKVTWKFKKSIFAISLQLLRFKLETMCGVLNGSDWKGKIKSQNFKSLFSSHPKSSFWVRTEKWLEKFKKSIFVFLYSISLVYPKACKCMQKKSKRV